MSPQSKSQSKSQAQSQAHVHKLIAKVAQEATAELYELVMSNNLVRDEWKRQHPGANEKALLAAFVNRNWSRSIPVARATLTRLLTTPIDTARKEEIMEALVLDASLIRGRQAAGIRDTNSEDLNHV